jgi:hypothetical protein
VETSKAELKIRLVTETCIGIGQLKIAKELNLLLVCMVKEDLQKTEEAMKRDFKEYEMLYLDETPLNVIYLSIDNKSSQNNYKEIYSWVEHQLSSGGVSPSNPGPYLYNGK